MTLVILYGPPAVGKLTVGIELAKLTGYKLFHNHLTTDTVRSLFPRGTVGDELIQRFRLELLETAAQAKLPGVVHTYM